MPTGIYSRTPQMYAYRKLKPSPLIRQRDGFKCKLCGISEEEHKKKFNRVLSVNHIDFNKNNCKKDNLNTLCLSCNTKINKDRQRWIEYFLNS